MADGTTRSEQSGIFWINDTSASEQSFVLVPGVSRATKFGIASSSEKVTKIRDKGACKKSTKIDRRPLQTGPSVTFKVQDLLHPQTAVSMNPTTAPHANKGTPLLQPITTRTQTSLKDLCPEDKRRIANLIEELARVSEEKDESVQRLRDEQETFERKIQQLEQQNVLIVQERESLQQQYKECQELLGLYQQYLSQEQQKLNQSIAELHTKVYTSSHPAPGPEGLPRSRTRARGGTPADETASDLTPPDGSSSGESGPANARMPRRRARRGCGQCSTSATRPKARGDNSCLAYDDRSCCRHEALSRPSAGPAAAAAGAPCGAQAATPALTDPLLGHEDWEERRHQLLLQKLQLEAEREGLRARLAEQEERLARQGRQLRQSRLDYSRFQHATQAGPAPVITGGGASHCQTPSDRRLSFGQCDDADAAELLLSKDTPHTSAGSPQKERSTHGDSRCSRQDMATSPMATFPCAPEPVPAPGLPPTSSEARLDSSLLEMMEVFSPISVPAQRHPSFQRHNATVPHSALKQGTVRTASSCWASLSSSTAGHSTQNPQQDLEESQILEDIFFIC